MTFGESVSTCFRKYAIFEGRASRSEYWWFWLFYLLILVGCELIDETLMAIAELVFLLPNLAVFVRRCHDSSHSGWWILCPIYNLILMFYESDPDTNDYGSLEG